MKKMNICTFAILLIMTMAVLTACGRKDSGTNQTTNPSSSQSTSGANQGSMNESGTTNGGTDNGNRGNSQMQESTSAGSSSQGGKADEESSTGVIGGMVDDLEDGVDDILNGTETSRGTNESK